MKFPLLIIFNNNTLFFGGIKMAKEKEHINLAFIGHVDHGKSTTVGRLLFDSGTIDEQTMRKLKDKAAELGKSGFEFAYVMDNLKEERERGVTIDLAHKKFETDKYLFTIIDAPGHKDFVKNMITGTSQADAAVLIVSAKEGPQPQTKEHAFLARTLGVGQMIVGINKMDTVNYDENRFNEVKKEMEGLLKTIGYKTDTVPIIPISAYNGDNIAKKSDKTNEDSFILPIPFQLVTICKCHGLSPSTIMSLARSLIISLFSNAFKICSNLLLSSTFSCLCIVTRKYLPFFNSSFLSILDFLLDNKFPISFFDLKIGF